MNAVLVEIDDLAWAGLGTLASSFQTGARRQAHARLGSLAYRTPGVTA